MFYQEILLQSTCQIEVFSSALNLDLIKSQPFSGKKNLKNGLNKKNVIIVIISVSMICYHA